MFKLHIYNPEHDIALGKNTAFFTPPKAAKMTREKYCHIPALWADDDDWVLVPSHDFNQEPHQAPHEGEMFNSLAKVKFVTFEELSKLKAEEMPEKVEPWGWDKLVVSQLIRCNPFFEKLVPDDDELGEIRRMSSREFVAENILPQLVTKDDVFIGEMKVFKGTIDELEEIIKNSDSIVLKSPWSCSGRGVRFVEEKLTESEKGWVRNILHEQGAIMIEPKYNKVLDFAMEFKYQENSVEYIGLNVFETHEGKYIRNLGANETERLQFLQRYIPLTLLDHLRNNILDLTTTLFNSSSLLAKKAWVTNFGIDMMLLLDANNKTKVHPCVEMNLRRTMGQIL